MGDELEQAKFELERLLKAAIQQQLAETKWTPKGYFGQVKQNIKAPKNNTKFLSNSVVVDVTGAEEGNYEVNIDVSFGAASNYAYIVENGRLPGRPFQKQIRRRKADGSLGEPFTITSYTKYPPLDKIKSWVRQKPALGEILDIDQRTFLAARSIAKWGIGRTDFVQKAFMQVEKDVEDQLSELARLLLESYLERIRNIDDRQRN